MAADSRLPRRREIEEAIDLDPLFVEFQTALAGRYSLERELGRGGMGVVYLAREVSLDRPVAIKLLPPRLAADPALRDRFLREARTAAQLSHPNIVAIHAVDDASGFVYFVMAFIDGDTLGERVRRQGPLPPHDAARILREIAWALGYAHRQGVIHRDLKPDNILLEHGSGRAVLTDFGIARRLDSTGLTTGGELIGTPEYMSPEQATGAELDGRTDLYSLGIVGFFALSGRLPFESETIPGLLVQHASEPAPALAPLAPGAPRALSQAVMRCLEKAPGGRHRDAKAFAEALSTAIETRKEIPPAVRAFVKDSLEIRATGCLYIGAIVWIGPMFLVRMIMAAGIPPTAAVLAAALLGITVAFGAVPLMLHVRRIRRLIRAGYGIEDVLAGARADLDQKREEIAFTVGRESTLLERGLQVAGKVGAFVAATGIVAMIAGYGTFYRTPFVPLMIALGAGAWVVGTVVGQRRRDVLGERRIRYFSSKFGRWLFRIAGAGLKARSGTTAATHRPTELALAFAAEDLYSGLPKALRASLPELPPLLKRLEAQARGLREKIDGLEEALAGADQDGSATAGTRRRAILDDLTAARDLARERLSETVAALETIRLDLLRLRAGAANADRITADLRAVSEIGGAVDRLLEAGAEVEDALGKTGEGGRGKGEGGKGG